MLDSTGLNRSRLPAKPYLESALPAAGAAELHFSFFFRVCNKFQNRGRFAVIRSAM